MKIYKEWLFGIVLLWMITSALTACGSKDQNEPGDLIISEETSSLTGEDSETDIQIVEESPDTSETLPKQPILSEIAYNFTKYPQAAPASSSEVYKRPPVRGIYVSGHAAGISDWMESLIALADQTELNAFVIDIKDDNGKITYNMDLPILDELGAKGSHIKNMEALMDKLYEHDIYPIARIVTFKDPFLAEKRPDLAIKKQDGSLWYYKKVAWLNPYNKGAWEYVVNIAKEAAKIGFKEIQFDYIRFEATAELKHASFDGLEDGKTRQEIILEFLDYANAELAPYQVEIGADVFGIVINSPGDAAVIGQDYLEMSKRLDVICPMVYPSHYGFGFYGTPKGEHSDLYPYRVIKGSMEDSNEVLSVIGDGEKKAVVRPWLQAFTASYLGKGNYKVYDAAAIRDQIQAAYDAGLEEWLLWHAGVKYNSTYLLPEDTAAQEEN